ncbi:mucin-binding protein [Lactobacillus crispatus]|uniref:mucin-binding protein n=1 Tax=Lactobacillus crispatus TaxID=47770 RepID=UPI0018E319A6|nr:YSIRK-type signal peptide-containing protein [Lactobacillus crispatus]MBI1704258.1 hypothetical protein [Lactobacillus crispatus]
MQRRKSFFNNEMEQRFSLRKYTIGLCSVCLGFVTIGMGSQSVKADTVNNVEKSSVVQENKTQDADSATAKPNITPTETKKNEVGSVAPTAPKTNTTSNGVKANTSDQSKSEDSSAVAPTSEKNQLQTSQDSSIKVKENNLNNDKRDTKKLVAKPTNLHDESDSPTVSISYVDDDENGRLIWKPDTLTTKNSLVVTYIQANLKKLENYILVPNQNLPDTIDVGNKAIDPIIVHLKHKTEQMEVTNEFEQAAGFTLSGPYGALIVSKNSHDFTTTDQKLFIEGTQKYDLVTRNFIGEATWDYSHIYQDEGYDDKGNRKKSTEVKYLDTINSLGDLDKIYTNGGGIYYPESSQDEEQYKDLDKLISESDNNNGVISAQTWLKDGLHADGYYLSEKTSLVFDGKSWLNLKEYQEKVDPNFTWTTTSSPEVMQGDHAVDHINPEKITSDLLPKLDSELTGMDGGRCIFLNYVPYTYKHHSAQRTINIHLPNGEVKTVSQKADVKQPVFTVYTLPDARNDKLPSQETGNWTGGEWAEYDAPVVAGYTASQPTVSAKTVTGDTQNETIDITYVASEHTSHVKLVDNDNKTIQDTPVMGKTGETANVSVTVPKGWQLVSGQELPTQISFNAEGHPDVIVQIEHKTEQRNVTKTFGQEAAFTLSGSYGATLNDSTGGYISTDQTLFIKGTQKYDLVTGRYIGEATWDYNHIYQGNGNDDDATEVKDLATINGLVDLNKAYIFAGGIYYAESQDRDSQDKDLQQQGKDLAKILDAHPDDPISTQAWLKDGLHADGYYLSEKTSYVYDTSGRVMNLAEYQQKVDPNFTWTTTNDAVVMLGDHAVDHINPEKITPKLLPELDTDRTNMLGIDAKDGMDGGRVILFNYVPYRYTHHSAQRTINIHLPNGEVKTITQKADAKQPVFTVYPLSDARNKLASQEKGNWISGEWAEYDAPVVAGYTVSQPTVSAKTVTGDTQNETIDITYVASEHTSHVKLVDNDNKTIQDTPVMGKTGETANVSVTVPKGWQLVSGQELPTQISFNAEGHPDVVVQIEHKTIKVTPDNPKENGTVLPDNPSLHFNGVSHNDLNKTVTREVTITDPTGKKSTTTQTVTFTRGATVDEVTNKVTYDDWSENGKHTFDKVEVPTVQGYTASGEVPSIVVTPETQSSKVDITYSANAQTATITYIDDTEKKTLGSDKQNGKFNQVITFEHDPAEVIKGLEEKGYKLVSNDFNSNKYQADNSNNVFYVHFAHGTKKVSREHSASFTVHYIYKDGRQAKPDHEQALSFTENGIQDLVTQKITWTPADSQKFDDVVTPVITGYTPDQDKVIGQTANFETGDREVTVTYLPDGQVGHINYIDDNTGKTLTRDDFSGKTNEHEDYTPIDRIQEFENKGYVFVSSDYPDGGFNFDDNDQQDQVFNVHLKHGTTTVTPDNPGHPGEPVDPKNPEGPKYPNGTELDQVKRTGTQTIHYVGAGDKTPADNKQTFIFTREITFDNVTREIISKTPWNVKSHTFGNVDTPVIPGYHTDTAVAGGATVTPDDLNKVIIVTYAPDGGSGDNPGSNGGGDQGTTSTPEPVPEPTPSPDDQPDTTLPSDNNTNKDVEKDKQDKPEEVKKARKIIKTRITKQEHIGNAEKAEHLTEQKHNDQTVVSPVKNEANEPQLPQTGEANTSVIGLLGMLVAGFAAILGFESSRSRKHKN